MVTVAQPVTTVDLSEQPGVPLVSLGLGYLIDVGTATIEEPLTLEIPFDASLMPEGAEHSDLFLAYLDENTGTWMPVPSEIDLDRGVLIYETTHLSWWNPFSWDWSGWVGQLKSLLSLRLSSFLDFAIDLSTECPEQGDEASVVNDTNLIRGCVLQESDASVSFRVTNQHAFPVEANVPRGHISTTILGPGEHVDISVERLEASPLLVSGDMVLGEALVMFLLESMLDAAPGWEILRSSNRYYVAFNSMLLLLRSEIQAVGISDALERGDTLAAFDGALEILSQDSAVAGILQILRTYGVNLVSENWLKSASKYMFALESNLTWMDILINYAFNAHNEIHLQWTKVAAPTPTPSPSPTPSPTPTPSRQSGLEVPDFLSPYEPLIRGLETALRDGDRAALRDLLRWGDTPGTLLFHDEGLMLDLPENLEVFFGPRVRVDRLAAEPGNDYQDELYGVVLTGVGGAQFPFIESIDGSTLSRSISGDEVLLVFAQGSFPKEGAPSARYPGFYLVRLQGPFVTWWEEAQLPTESPAPESSSVGLPRSICLLPTAEDGGVDVGAPDVQASTRQIEQVIQGINTFSLANGEVFEAVIYSRQPWSLTIELYSSAFDLHLPQDDAHYEPSRTAFREAASIVLEWMRRSGIDTEVIYASWGADAALARRADDWLGVGGSC